MGSNEATPELQEKEENDNNSSSTTPSDELGSNDSNVSCVDNLAAVPKLKEMQIFIPCETPHNGVCARVELKELDDGGGGGGGGGGEYSGLKPPAEDELKNNNEDQVMVDVCTTEVGSTDGSLLQVQNAVDDDTAETTEAFSGVFDVSKVRELIESDPFIREVVDSFLMHCDEMKSEEEQNGNNNNNNNACANGGSTLSVSDDVSDVDAEMPQANKES